MGNATQVYPIGIPMAFFAMLWRKRRLINPPKDPLAADALAVSDGLYGRPLEPDARLSDRRIAQTAFLWRVSDYASWFGLWFKYSDVWHTVLHAR